MPRDGWFDGRGVDLVNSTKAALKEKWDKFLKDGKISGDECINLHREIHGLLRKIEPTLDDETHRTITPVLVMYEMLVELEIMRSSNMPAS